MQGLAHMQESAQRWEAQAQENLQHMDQLKSLLEESAFWQSQSAQLSTADADGSNSDHQRAPDGKHCCKVVSHLTRTTLKTCVAARQLPPLTDQLMCTSMLPPPPTLCCVIIPIILCLQRRNCKRRCCKRRRVQLGLRSRSGLCALSLHMLGKMQVFCWHHRNLYMPMYGNKTVQRCMCVTDHP